MGGEVRNSGEELHANLEGYVSITYQFFFGIHCCYPKKKRGWGVGCGDEEFRPLMLEKTGSLQSPPLTYKVSTPYRYKRI